MRAWLHRFHCAIERVDDWMEARLKGVPTWVVWVALAILLSASISVSLVNAIARRLAELPSPPVQAETWIGLAVVVFPSAGVLVAALIFFDRRRTRRRDATRSRSDS